MKSMNKLLVDSRRCCHSFPNCMYSCQCVFLHRMSTMKYVHPFVATIIIITLSIVRVGLSQIFPGFSPPLYKLTKLNVDPRQVTVSGFSSGGAQAMQFHVAHSSKLLGAGIFAGVPYMSGHDRNRDDFFVHEPDKFNITQLVEFAKTYAEMNMSDDTSNLNGSRVYVYHGKRDSTVHSGCGMVIEKIYSTFDANVYSVSNIDSEHGMPSDNSGGPCGLVNLAYSLVNKCDYNGVYDMFNYLYGGNLEKPSGTVGTVTLDNGQFLKFDQSEFFPDNKPALASMDKMGFMYIPSGCHESLNETCRLGFVFHGCLQDRFNYGEKFPRTTGYLETAELNKIVLVFPQIAPSLFSPRNPQSCWDWWGFTSKYYATRDGLQIQAIKSMMDRIVGDDEN